MDSVRIAALAAMLSLCAVNSHAEPMDNEERIRILKSLNWNQGGKFDLQKAGADLNVSGDYRVLDQQDAQRFVQLNNGGVRDDRVDALMIDPKSHDFVLFESIQEGYVKSDDWNSVDADQMLKDITDNTEQHNEEKAKEGIAPLHVTGWGQRPVFDAAAHSVHWSINATEGGNPITNAVELILGRHGYEKLTWVGDAQHTSSALLQQAHDDFSFKTGASYGDFKDGDKVAAYGLGALIAATVGAKVAAKFGLLALFAVFFKKAAALVVVGIALLRKKLKGLFSKPGQEQFGDRKDRNML